MKTLSGFLLLLLVVRAAATPSEQVMALLERAQAAGSPGASAAVAVNGEIVFSGGVGFSNLESGLPQNGASVHNIGSISKTIAVVAIMQLCEQGKVDLDADIRTYLPWFPQKEKPITLRQILTHTSGIGKYGTAEYTPDEPATFRQFHSFEESTKSWRDDPLLFTPGTRWHYSGAVNLIQGIVESVSGLPFEDYMRRFVWEPAGMTSTQFDVPARIVPRRGRGYWRNPKSGQLENFPDSDESYNYAGGGIISSDEDLCRLAVALNSGLLLQAKSRTEMYRKQLPADFPLTEKGAAILAARRPGLPPYRPGEAQALLWVVGQDTAGRSYVGHTGGAKGTSSVLIIYPEQNVAVALHLNFDRLARNFELVEAIAQIFLPPPVRK